MRPLRIVTYNVRYFGHGTRGIVSTRRSFQKVARGIASLAPLADVVCLQEVETRSLRSNLARRSTKDGETQLDHLMAVLDLDCYEACYFPAHRYKLGGSAHLYTTGLAILVHRDLAIDHHNAHAPSDITHRRSQALRGLKQTRICAHVRVRRGKEPAVDVFNTHLSLPSAVAKEFWTKPARMGWGKNQVQEAKNLAKFVEAEKKSDRFVIVGDFNSLPGSPVYEMLVKELGYGDPFARLHRMTTGELSSWPTAGFMSMRMHIDHVLTGPGLEWVDFDGSHAFGDRSSPFHGVSDHVPIVGRFRAR
jgi:endonuclease/exonuclease/phosphatase family metal-dependent hydrolase